jgi:hypothetical protein
MAVSTNGLSGLKAKSSQFRALSSRFRRGSGDGMWAMIHVVDPDRPLFAGAGS